MEEVTRSTDELLANELVFLDLCPPNCSFSSSEVIGNSCCSKNCVLYIKRLDILMARFLYVSYFKSLGSPSKQHARKLFVSTLKRGTQDGILLVPIVADWIVCPTVVARTFGMSLNMLLNELSDASLDRPVYRDWYAKTIDKISNALHHLSKHVQINSLGQVMVPPMYATRTVDSDCQLIDIKLVRERMDVKIRQRVADTLVRCSTCTALSEIIKTAPPDDKEALLLLKSHHRIVSAQRAIMATLYQQSRDKDVDILVMNVDGMSNRHSKLPVLIQRPKCVTDTDRLPLSISTIQIASQFASSCFRNFDYVSLSNVFSHDSNFNISLIIDALTKIDSLPSNLVIIADSARNNKSHLMIGALALLLARVKQLKQIRLMYPVTGHTHNAVDGHFGSISTVLKKSNAITPDDFCNVLRGMDSVAGVETSPTIYDFSTILNFMNKPHHLCSNSQILLSKDASGIVYWSSAKTMTSMELFHSERMETTFKCFVDDFDPLKFKPTIRKPASEAVRAKIDHLLHVGGAFFTDVHRQSFYSSLDKYSKQAFRWQIVVLNNKPQKVNHVCDNNLDDQHATIIQYLAKKGFNITKFPKDPVVTNSML